MEDNIMVLGKDQTYSLDCHKTRVNNNVLVVGTSGSGKTRGIVIPNLLQATGSYVVTDPKGNLYQTYGGYLRRKGYIVKKLDFTNPAKSARYNFFRYIRNTQDIRKIAHMLIYQNKDTGYKDPFWDEASELLLQAVIAYLWEAWPKESQNLHGLLGLIEMAQVSGDMDDEKTPLDEMFEQYQSIKKESFAISSYNRFRVAASRTLRSILITVNAKLGGYDTPELTKMLSEDTVNIPAIGKDMTAIFVVVSDTDRSIDGLVNIFFTQAMNELCSVADRECENSALPRPVRFIMDDFATNCTIAEFPRMISSIRSRNISTMLMIQAESQLTEHFGHDGRTIIGNCDTYVYMGGNDVETARAVSERCNIPMQKVLNMPVGSSWIFRRGQAPVNGEVLDLETYITQRGYKVFDAEARKKRHEYRERICKSAGCL